MKVILPAFTIKAVSRKKVTNEPKQHSNNISRKCYAVVKEIEGEFKAIINIDKKHIYIKEGDECTNESLVLPFTEKSLDLKDKNYVFLKEKDKYGHYVCVIRTNSVANLYPGLSTQYNAIHDNLLIAGHIIRKNGRMYFEYEDLIAHHYLSEAHIQDVKIDNDKPLFNK